MLEKVQKLSDSIERRCLRKDIDTFLDGHLNMNLHRITGILNPFDDSDAVTKRCTKVSRCSFSCFKLNPWSSREIREKIY